MDGAGDTLGHRLVARLRPMLAPGGEFVPLHIPEFLGRERELVLDCIDTGWVSSVGAHVDAFEARVAGVCGAAHGVAVANGTAALQVALQVAGVAPGDEVLMPALTFVATANAASHLGAMPHFVDSTRDTLGLCPARLARHLDKIAERRGDAVYNKGTGRRIAAVVPVHIFGCPVDMEALRAVVADWPMPIVEDAAEALGSTYRGQPCGSLGDIAALSFNGNKILTTGGGGAIVTNDAAMAARAKHLTTTAKVPHIWDFDHDEVGYNYRMPNLNAALGVAQLEQLDTRLEAKARLQARYAKALDGLPGVSLFSAPQGSVCNNWLVTVLLKDADARNTVLQTLNDAGLMARPIWRLMHRLPMYRDAPRADLAEAEDLEARVINLPSSAYLAGART